MRNVCRAAAERAAPRWCQASKSSHCKPSSSSRTTCSHSRVAVLKLRKTVADFLATRRISAAGMAAFTRSLPLMTNSDSLPIAAIYTRRSR